MARSLSLAAYMAFARRQPTSLPKITMPRADGELIWIHCADPDRSRTLAQLGLRLAAQRLNATVLLTTSPGQRPKQELPEGVVWQECPSENPSDVRVFLNHWRPDLMVWLGPWLRPVLIDDAKRRGVASILVEADTLGLANRRWRWLPEPTQATLRLFSSVFAMHRMAADRFQKPLKDTPTIVHNSGPLSEESQPLPYNETDLNELRTACAGRPVWLAARMQLQELPLVLNAYRKVLRLSHRMLLIVVPDTPECAPTMRQALIDAGLRFCEWEDGAFPNDNTHVLLAETTDELGLWFRAAPVTLMGSSLASGFGGRDPLEPAALGSAILHGPSVRRHLDAYNRLSKAGGAQLVKDANGLAEHLTRLTAPDKAAAMAHAGWQVVSAGAEVSDQIVAEAQRLLDEKEVYA